MMTQHTHGPWSYEVHELSEGYSAIVYDEHGCAIADHLTEDRARLIAAAPELLEALEGLLKDYIQVFSDHPAIEPDWNPEDSALVKRARATIAKATAGGAA